jgi:hypothetical protein
MKNLLILSFFFSGFNCFSQTIEVDLTMQDLKKLNLNLVIINKLRNKIAINTPIYENIEVEIKDNGKWEEVAPEWIESLILKNKLDTTATKEIVKVLETNKYIISSKEVVKLEIPFDFFANGNNPYNYRARYKNVSGVLLNTKLLKKKSIVLISKWVYFSAP